MDIIERWRRQAPDDPLWKGVAEATVQDDAVRIRFRDGLTPRELELGRARVLCHLYDEDALASAAANRTAT